MSDETRQVDPEVRRVVDESTCVRCRYWLRGLSAGGLCPECGERIEASLSPNRLLRGDPRRLRQMQLGCVGIAMSPYIGVLCGTLGISFYDELFYGVLCTAIALCFLESLLLLSVRPHGDSHRLPSESIRRRLRLCWVIVVGFASIGLAAIAFGSLSTFLICCALGLLFTWLLGWHVIEYSWQLACFADAEPLSRRLRATTLYYKICAVGVGAFSLLLLLMLYEDAPRGPAASALGVVVVVLWLTVTLVGLVACVLVFVLTVLLASLAVALNRPLGEARVLRGSR